MTDPTKPMSGMRVVELCHVAAGPFASMLLADLGAEVIKVEGPHGDQMRSWPPLERTASNVTFSHNFASVNRNKRSIQLDLTSDSGRSEARRLVAQADVLIENFRPGVLARFGLDFDSVTARHRGLVYCSISGYGQTSPLASHAAYDVIIQAASGLMSVTGEPDGPPAKCGVPVADFIAGLYAAYTIAALYPVTQAEGRSFQVDCPMLDCLLSTAALQVSEYLGSGREPRRMGSRHPRNAPYQAFAASDTTFVLAAGNDQLWRKLCDVIGRPDLVSDPLYIDQVARAQNQDTLIAALSPIFAARTAAEWLQDLGAVGVPCGPVHTFGEILGSDHVRETGLLEEIPISGAGTIRMVGFPVLIDGNRPIAELGAPLLGEHTESIRNQWLGDGPNPGQ